MKRIVIGISGVSGFPLALCLLRNLPRIKKRTAERHILNSKTKIYAAIKPLKLKKYIAIYTVSA